MVTATRTTNAVTAYAEAVVAGEIVTGRLVRLAAQRHLDDLQHGHERGLWFDEAKAEKVIKFYSLLPHIKGEWASDPTKGIDLAPWQAFTVGSVMGWKREDGSRRFRTWYEEVGRKNGKSTKMSPLSLWLAFFDDEPGSETYSAATTRDQAKIVWNDARAMVLKRPALKKHIQVLAHSLHSTSTNSLFRPLAAEADNLDGLNIHAAIVDELHAHPNRKVVDVLETATSARRQPLICYITTAGFDRNSVCWSHHDYSQRVLEGQIVDDTWFAYIACLDDGDDWRDPSVWVKANPNLGVSVKVDDLERKCARAQAIPSEQQDFRRKHCNEWTESSTRWLDLDRWDALKGEVDATALEGRVCYGGLDLSSTTDTTALTLVFPDDAGGYDVLSYAWLPEENIRQRADRDRAPYGVWADEGYLTLTDGNVVDYDHVEQTVKLLATKYNLKELAIDRWNSTGTQTRLMAEGITVVPFGQGFASMNPAAKELERLVLAGSLRHGGNPVLRWAASNVVIQSDAAGNIKPAKDKSTGRIDPIVALVMALGRAMLHTTEQPDVYAERGYLEVEWG